MRKTKRSVRILGGLALASLALVGSMSGWSQQSPINPLDALRTMSQSDRDSLLKNFGIDPSALHRDSGSRTDRTRTDNSQFQNAPLQMPIDPKQVERERTYLQPGDTLVIQLDFHLEPLAPPETLQTATAAAQAAAAGAIRPDQMQLPPGAAAAAQQQQQQQPQAQPQGKGPNNDAEEELPADVRDHLQKLIDLIRSRNPYQLSRDGTLWLPGFPGMPLSGLTEQQATLRLQADPSFAQLQVRVLRLPLEKQGPEGLLPFGYDLFDEAPSTFAPVTDVPVPADYVLGPGDELNVQLYGNDGRTLSLVVDREGAIDFPQIGPLRVGGLRFNDAKHNIENRVRQQMIGVQANVSMGDTRSIQVFVLGEAKKPGAYTISGLGTVTSALYASGGLRAIGSLRHIQVKRQGKVIRELDLYDLLLRGDTTDDTKLLPGDVIFVPPVGPVAAVYGEVHRPAIYELRNENTVSQLIALAGGLTSEAQLSRGVLTQIDAQQRRVATNIDLTQTAGPPLRNGDVLRVDRLRSTLDAGVTLGGHIFTPGTVAYREGLRLSNVISSVDELRPNADIHYLLVRRELPPNRRIAVVSADLAAALAAPGSDADIPLQPRDQITVFDLESGRDRVIAPLINELRLQSGLANPTELVRIDGRAKVPGEYPLEPGMTVSDLIRAGGGLEDAAYGGRAELSRYNVVNGEARRTELLSIDLAAVLRGDSKEDFVLQPFDDLSIKEVQDWGGQEQITLMGEVRFPGKYSIKRGETLKSVLARAGGLNDQAFPDGAVFTRTELKDREQKQLDVLAGRLQNDLATLALQGAAANQANAAQAFTVGQSLLSQLKGAKATGRLVIDLPRTMRANLGSQSDLILRDGDTLIVPRRPQEVTVIGEVQSPTSHLYREELSRSDYISLSGGETRKADKGSVYVVRADGSVIAHGNRRWFSGGSVAMKPGDTVVVPLDTERLPALPFWQAVTQILYNLSISAAAVNSF